MSLVTIILDARFSDKTSTLREQLIAIGEGLTLTVTSVFTRILAVFGISIAINAAGIPSTDAVQLLRSASHSLISRSAPLAVTRSNSGSRRPAVSPGLSPSLC